MESGEREGRERGERKRADSVIELLEEALLFVLAGALFS